MDDDDFQTDAVDETAIDVPEQGESEAPQPRTVEDIAAAMGWTPKENWRGPEDKWKPADEFVAATAEINSKVTTKLKTLEQQLSNINRTNAMVTERLLAEQREKLLQERQDAFDMGDSAKFSEAEAKLNQLQQTSVPVEQPPEVQSFVERHAAWFGKDPEATAWAKNRSTQLHESGLSAARQLAVIERELGTYFPEYAPKPEQPKAKAAPLTQPGSRGNTPRGKSFSDLPKEAQEAALYFEKKGVSREQYVKSYFEGQSA